MYGCVQYEEICYITMYILSKNVPLLCCVCILGWGFRIDADGVSIVHHVVVVVVVFFVHAFVVVVKEAVQYVYGDSKVMPL